MKDVLGNHLKDRLFHLVHWLRITNQESINLGRKSYLDCSSDTLCTRGGISKGDILVADIEELETVDASEIYSKRLNAKEVIFPKQNGNFYFSSCRWTNQTSRRRSGTENTHSRIHTVTEPKITIILQQDERSIAKDVGPSSERCNTGQQQTFLIW